MKRQEKILKRKTRAFNRRAKRMRQYISRIYAAKELGDSIPLCVVRKDGKSGNWKDNNSSTGYSQICSYKGICQYPCNGDC